VRLADKEGLYQEQAAERMNISRQTFGRIIESARKKIADALINGKALVIEGGTVEIGHMPPAASGPCPGIDINPGRRCHRHRGRGRRRP